MLSSAFLRRLAAGVARCGPEDREALLQFRRSIGERTRARSTPEFFSWQFERTPALTGQAPQIWIYKKDDRIVGQQGGIPVELKVGDRRLRGSWAVDLHIEPAFRLRGIGVALNETYLRENDVTMALGVTDEARHAFSRAGWIDLGTVPLFVRPLRTDRLLAVRGGGHGGRLVGAVADVPLRAIDLAALVGLRLYGLHWQEVDRFDEAADRLWEAAAGHFPVLAGRDRAYLNWRYADFPRSGCYRLFHLQRRDDAVAFAVLRMGTRHDLPAGYIVDYLCEPRWIKAVFAACILQCRRWGLSAVYCLHDGPWATPALRRLGFVPRQSTTHLMFKPTTAADGPGVVDAAAMALLRDRRHWFVTMGDSDADGAVTEGAPL